MIKRTPLCMKIIAVGSILSSVMAVLALCLLLYMPQSSDAILLSGKIDVLALLAQRVLSGAVFCAIVSDVFKIKKPSEN